MRSEDLINYLEVQLEEAVELVIKLKQQIQDERRKSVEWEKKIWRIK